MASSPAPSNTPPTTTTTPLDLTSNSTRFTLELEFTTLLSNPYYIYHLATTPAASFPEVALPLPFPPLKPGNADMTTNSGTSTRSKPTTTDSNPKINPTQPLLLNPNFTRYLSYLAYWRHPSYVKYLQYPELSLRHLALLCSESFRREVCGAKGWEVVVGLVEGGIARGGRGDGDGARAGIPAGGEEERGGEQRGPTIGDSKDSVTV